MSNLIGQELIDRLYDILLTDVKNNTDLQNDPTNQFDPNHLDVPSLPAAFDKLLQEGFSASNIIQALNEIKTSFNSLNISTDFKLNEQFNVLGDYLADPTLKQGMLNIDENILLVISQLNNRVKEVEPLEPSIDLLLASPQEVGIDSTTLSFPLLPDTGLFSVSDVNGATLNDGSSDVDCVMAIVGNNLEVTLPVLVGGTSYTLTIKPRTFSNGSNPNRQSFEHSFSTSLAEVVPTFDLASATPSQGSSDSNPYTLSKIEIPVNSVGHLNELVLAGAPSITVIGNDGLSTDVYSSSSFDNNERILTINLDQPTVESLGSSITYTVSLGSNTILDGASGNTLNNSLTFSTAASSSDIGYGSSAVEGSFTVLEGSSSFKPAFQLDSIMDDDSIYGPSSYDGNDRKVFIAHISGDHPTQVAEIMELSILGSATPNLYGTSYSIDLKNNLIQFDNAMIGSDQKFFIIVYLRAKTDLVSIKTEIESIINA